MDYKNISNEVICVKHWQRFMFSPPLDNWSEFLAGNAAGALFLLFLDIVWTWSHCLFLLLYSFSSIFLEQIKTDNTTHFLWLILFLFFLYYIIFPKLLNFYQYSLFKVLYFSYTVNRQECPEKNKQGSVGKYEWLKTINYLLKVLKHVIKLQQLKWYEIK